MTALDSRRKGLDEEALDGVLEVIDLGLELAALVRGNGGSNDRARDTTGATKGDLGGDEDVGDVLVLAEEGQVEDDLDGLGVGSHHDHLSNTTVERLGGWRNNT